VGVDPSEMAPLGVAAAFIGAIVVLFFLITLPLAIRVIFSMRREKKRLRNVAPLSQEELDRARKAHHASIEKMMEKRRTKSSDSG
jgi:hypothetical protein